MAKQITTEDFDRILHDIVVDQADCLLSVPGVYEVVSEYYNNEVLDKWTEEQGQQEGEGE